MSGWFVRARVVMGSATFFDAFNALSIAFVLPILVPLWHITAPEIGFLIGASYVGQIIGALAFSWAAERYGRVPCAAAARAAGDSPPSNWMMLASMQCLANKPSSKAT